MLVQKVILAVALAGFAAAQTVEGTACAGVCIAAVAPAVGCEETDLACMCASEAFFPAMEPCVSACEGITMDQVRSNCPGGSGTSSESESGSPSETGEPNASETGEPPESQAPSTEVPPETSRPPTGSSSASPSSPRSTAPAPATSTTRKNAASRPQIAAYLPMGAAAIAAVVL
ncbi:hypothetical protein FA15DRAFT_705360 [Coprinopsis marcescibilis]|uniref:CFEM domain-containing protein n=1 Tax=Coprinopsis marcescibilis TaxID=230819 RepID=A0A5C3KTQ4_COPMA|nr:hypothetical protein FA15DRAFT_705360 [Coprinopsis marcescibilis]